MKKLLINLFICVSTYCYGLDAPIVQTPSHITEVSFSANWTFVNGATSYELDVWTDGANTNDVIDNLNIGDINNYSVTGLSCGILYYYRVRAVNSSETSANSNAQSVATIIPPPVIQSATFINGDEFTANWSSVSCAGLGYALDVWTEGSLTNDILDNKYVGLVTQKKVTGLSCGTAYYYRVRALNTTGFSANSSSQSVNTLSIGIPETDHIHSPTENSFTASWRTVSCATSYRLDVSEDEDFSSMIPGYNDLDVGNEITKLVDGLSCNSDYYYRVRAVNGSGTSTNSDSNNGWTTVVTPNVYEASNVSDTSFTANWSSSNCVSYYLLDVSENSNFSTYIPGYQDKVVSSSSETIGGLSCGVYYYRVTAVTFSNGYPISRNSEVISVITLVSKPNALSAVGITDNSFDANWSNVNCATSYEIDVSIDSVFSSFVSGYENLNVGLVNSKMVEGLECGGTYFYRVRAKNDFGTSVSSDSEELTIAVVGTPNIEAATFISSDSFTANWSNVSCVDTYLLDVSKSSDFSTFVSGYQNLEIGDTTSWNVTGLAQCDTYYYRVRASKGIDESSFSQTYSVDTPISSPNIGQPTTITNNSFVANWPYWPCAISYRLDVSETSNFSTFVPGYENLDVGQTYSAVINGLSCNTAYYYRIRAVSDNETSGNSGYQAVITSYKPTLDDATSVVDSSFVANWTKLECATSYVLDVSKSDTFSTFVPGYDGLDVGDVASATVTGLSPCTYYYYRVRAKSGVFPSEYSPSKSVRTFGIPNNNGAINITTSSFVATWDKVSCATGYLLDVSTNNDFSSFLPGYENLEIWRFSNARQVSGLSCGTNYYYRVKAVSGYTTSESSNTGEAVTLVDAPTINEASSGSDDSFSLDWSPVDCASSYQLDVSTNSNFSTFVAGNDNLEVGNVTSYLVEGLDCGSTYFARVRASLGTQISANSSSKLAKTLPSTPIATDPSNFWINGKSFRANWTSVNCEESFYLDVSTESDFSSFVSGYENLYVGDVTHKTITGVSCATTYYYRVRAKKNGTTSLNSNYKSGTTLMGQPVAFNPTSITGESFKANWSFVDCADSYRIDVSTSSNFSSYVPGYFDLDVGNVTTKLITGLSCQTTYYYRVRSVGTEGTSYSSGTKTADTDRTPVAHDATSIGNDEFNANWSSIGCASSYQLDVSTVSDFSSYVSGYNQLPVSTNSEPVTGLLGSTTYYYRVRSKYNVGWSTYYSGWSNITEVTTTSAGARTSSKVNKGKSEGISERFSTTRVYPNPIQKNVSIEVSDLDFIRRIELHDLSGKLLLRTKEVSLQNSKYDLDLSHLKRGTYIISGYSESQKVFSKKIIKQ